MILAGKLIWAEVTPLHVRPATGQEYAKWLAANQVASALVFLIDNTTMAPIKTRADSLHMMGGTLLGQTERTRRLSRLQKKIY